MAVSPAPATQSVVAYQTPNARAIQTAGHAAIGFGAAVGVVIIPILIKFLASGDFSQTALTTLVTVVGAAILGVLLAYCSKYVQAKGSDVPPTLPPAA
jgi:mannose/fructose/N-acetylgalactosamine-specific phosphotransferase system component IIC